MARGNDGRKVFLKDSDYGAFLDRLLRLRESVIRFTSTPTF